MSRSNPETILKNPANRFYEWAGSTGELKYWDREKEENVFVKPPFTFIVLDMLTTVKGWNDREQLGYFANEVRDQFRDTITVRTKNGIAAQGLYEDVKHLNGAKFCRSLYIAYKDGDELMLGNIQAMGSFIGAWFDFCKTLGMPADHPDAPAITITGSHKDKKGSTEFYVPEFKATPLSDETRQAVIALDASLQSYIVPYLKQNKETDIPDDALGAMPPEAPFSDDFPPEDLPEDERSVAVGSKHDPQAPVKSAPVPAAGGTDDIPF